MRHHSKRDGLVIHCELRVEGVLCCATRSDVVTDEHEDVEFVRVTASDSSGAEQPANAGPESDTLGAVLAGRPG
jgi:hypothetical protein